MFGGFVLRSTRVATAVCAGLLTVATAVGVSPPSASAEAAPPRDVAIEWAKAQIGKPYRYGGTGPNGFDCSGLVMQAWSQAGVQLPRIASDQSGMTQRVPLSELQTGDIVSWGSNPNSAGSVYHVALYANDGIILDAPRTGRTVQLRSLDSMSHNLMPYGIRPAA